MDSSVDNFLLEQVALGDENAFALLYDRYGKSAYSLAYRILKNVQGAEDVVQDVFLNVWRLAGSFDARKGNARSWLLAMVHHRSIDSIRRRRDKTQMNLPMELEQPGTEAGVWREVMGNLERQVIEKALKQIPAEQRQAIDLAFFGGYTHQEISDNVQLPLGTVKSRIRMGMEKLRDLLKHQEAKV